MGGTYETPVLTGLLDEDFVEQLRLQGTFNDEAFKGKTFWDLIGEKGYKTTVIFPMNIKVNFK